MVHKGSTKAVPSDASVALETPPMPPGGERFGAWFDEGAAGAACAFFPRYLRFTEGEFAGRPFELQPWQRDRIIRPTFGWKRENGTRLIRTVYLAVGKKNGKTELGAGIGIIMVCADGEYGAQVYSTAMDKDQAKIAFNKACRMIVLSDTLKGELEVYKTAIFCPELMSSFKALSSSVVTKYGFNPSCNLADETHAMVDGALFQVIHDGFAGRRQPLEVLMTTGGENLFGWGWEQHQYAEKVRDGLIEDPSFLPVIFAADEDDDWTDEEVWAKANPNLDISVKRDFLRDQVAKALHNERLEGNFKRFHLTIWTSIGAKPISMKAWRACAGELDVAELAKSLEGRSCFGGLDLASKADLTSLVLVFPPVDEGEPWKVLVWFWLPAANMAKRVKGDRVPYDLWAKRDFIELTEGKVVDYDVIRARISGADVFKNLAKPPATVEALEPDAGGLAAKYDIQEIAFDRWNSTQLVTQLMGDGHTMVEFGQGFRSFAAPTKELIEVLVPGGRLAHGGNPVLAWNADNLRLNKDPADNMKPDKAKAEEKIDGMVALIMGLGRAIRSQGEDQGITVEKGYACVA